MIELMVVVSVMVVLAGLLIAALPGIQTRVNRNKVVTFMAELENGLSKYQVDFGTYPQNPTAGGDRTSRGIEGSSILYQELSGDRDLDGKVDGLDDPDADPGEDVYVAKLDYQSNLNANPQRSTTAGGKYLVIDAFGNPIMYLADPPNIDWNLKDGQKSNRGTYNATYDLWSFAEGEEGDEEKYIANWKSN